MTSQPNTIRKFKLQPLSLVRMFWKHKLLCVLIWVIITACGFAVVHQLPNVYRAEALILVESQRIPEKFVSPTISDDLKDRLSSLSQQILSSSRLLEIITRFDLYKEERQKRTQEEIIEMMRGDIGTQLEASWAKKVDSRPSAFRVSYEGQNPTVVALVANQLATFFINENVQAREVQATSTSEFLASQLTAARLRLEEQENKLGEYKVKFNGELPEQESALIAAVSQLQVRLQGINDATERAKQTRAMQESALASARASDAAISQLLEQINNPEPSSALALASGEPAKTSERLQQQLEKYMLVYTDEHPTVKALRKMIPEVRKEEEKKALEGKGAAKAAGSRGATEKAGSKAGDDESSISMITPAPKIRNERALQLTEALIRSREQADHLKAQQELATKELEALNQERKGILTRLDALEKAIGKLPIREQELASVKRDYEISKANYQSLLDKNLSAEMATEMERRQKAERFTVIDAARAPVKPVKPNRPLLYAACSLLGFALGIAFAMGKELKRNAVLGEWELPRGVPILGRVPRIVPVGSEPILRGNSPRRVLRFRLRPSLIASSVLLLLVAIAAATGMYLGQFGK